jgi:hypothetical protein
LPISFANDYDDDDDYRASASVVVAAVVSLRLSYTHAIR